MKNFNSYFKSLNELFDEPVEGWRYLPWTVVAAAAGKSDASKDNAQDVGAVATWWKSISEEKRTEMLRSEMRHLEAKAAAIRSILR